MSEFLRRFEWIMFLFISIEKKTDLHLISLSAFSGYCTFVWYTSASLLWFWFIELIVGALWNVPLCSLLVEAS